MKIKIILLCLGVVGLFLMPLLSNAQSVERISRFEAVLTVNADASLDVSEKITYDFGDNSRHGIFRNIPIKYKARGGNYNLKLSNVSVIDENGWPYNFDLNYSGNDAVIKIGDADKDVNGEKVYIINYTIEKAINYFDNHDELYWNVTGNDWPIVIEQASVVVFLPEKTSELSLQTDCFFGSYGGNNNCLSSIITEADGVNKIRFAVPENSTLISGDGLTVVLGWPKGMVYQPTWWEIAIETVRDNVILALPIVVFLFMLLLWRRKGADPKGRETIIVQFDSPDNISPAEVGLLMSEVVRNTDITAEIINLAINGFLKIVREEKKGILHTNVDYSLIKLKEADDKLNGFQTRLLDVLFSSNKKVVKISDLKNKINREISAIKKKIYLLAVNKKYFVSNPQSVRIIYLIAAVVIMVLGFWVVSPFFGVLGGVSVLASGVIVGVFSFLMPVKTRKGVLAKEHILGLKQYLSVVEKDRIKFHNAPERNPEIFEKFLPYAMVLGVEKEWSRQFKDIYNQQPDWYSDHSGIPFTSAILISNLNSFQSQAGSVLTHQSSAGSGGSGFSGGFSGGGFGGGGGGSW